MLTHYSKEPIVALRESNQSTDRRMRNYKPAGFWYSVDGDWERWCESEMPEWIKNKLCYEVTLGSENILRIRSASELIAFGNKYGKATQYGEFPDWSRVIAEYDGIEIAPYCWELRYELDWYYPWDCASGCLWRPSGTSLKLLTPGCVSAYDSSMAGSNPSLILLGHNRT